MVPIAYFPYLDLISTCSSHSTCFFSSLGKVLFPENIGVGGKYSFAAEDLLVRVVISIIAYLYPLFCKQEACNKEHPVFKLSLIYEAHWL